VARTKSRWVCQECGFQASGFLGRCTDCGAWNSLVEERVAEDFSGGKRPSPMLQILANGEGKSKGPVLLKDIETTASERLLTGISGLDEVLGGGLVPGAVVLLAGDPGIGKSTLLLQAAKMIASKNKVLYVTGEESAAQIRLRAQRLGIKDSELFIDAEQNVLSIAERMTIEPASVVIVDSVQSIYHPEVASAPGSVSQVRESAQVILAAAKAHDIATIIVGHVNKEGSIAGPRVLEHMVDVVLQFEPDRSRQLRILRTAKNRFGSTSEIAIFSMNESGLQEVENPSALLLGDRLKNLDRQAASGTAVIAGAEGHRTLLLEVQALVGVSSYPSPRRVANGWDYNRLLQIIAVLEKKVGLSLSNMDVYINIVGGLDFNDPSGDLGVSIAIATSLLDRSIDASLVIVGEVGLTAEVRPVPFLSQRLREASRLGFRRAIVPQANLPLGEGADLIKAVGVESLADALGITMPGAKIPSREKRAAATL
jgi:DNA repair protein RadA/Sms